MYAGRAVGVHPVRLARCRGGLCFVGAVHEPPSTSASKTKWRRVAPGVLPAQNRGRLVSRPYFQLFDK